MSSSEHFNDLDGEGDDFGADPQYEEYDAPHSEQGDDDSLDLEWRSVVEGTVAAAHSEYIEVEVPGSRFPGRIFPRELKKLDDELQRSLQSPGYTCDFYVQHTPREDSLNNDPFYELTISGLWRLEDWEAAAKALDSGETFEVVPLNFNRGGLIVRFGHSLEGFVPNSHIWNSSRDPVRREQMMEEMVESGEELTVKVIEVSQENRKLVLSNKEAEREQSRDRRRDALQDLRVGSVLPGVVRNIRDFGAFVDIGGVEGLLHISEINWDLVKHPRDFLTEGQEIEVKVLQIDHAKGHVKLSRKALLETPWATVSERYQVGDIVWVDITRKKDFGAFAFLEAGVEGLIHVSEIAPPSVQNPLSTIQEGDRVEVQIIRMDVPNQRIGLSRARVL